MNAPKVAEAKMKRGILMFRSKGATFGSEDDFDGRRRRRRGTQSRNRRGNVISSKNGDIINGNNVGAKVAFLKGTKRAADGGTLDGGEKSTMKKGALLISKTEGRLMGRIKRHGEGLKPSERRERNVKSGKRLRKVNEIELIRGRRVGTEVQEAGIERSFVIREIEHSLIEHSMRTRLDNVGLRIIIEDVLGGFGKA